MPKKTVKAKFADTGKLRINSIYFHLRGTMKNKKANFILIIDDEKLIRFVIDSFLKENGYITKKAASGKEGIALLKKNNFDLVLLDLNMPEMDGFEVLKIIKKDFPDIPVVVISGMDNQNNVVKSFRMGASDYLTKPIINFKIILHTIESAIEKTALIKENKEYEKNLEKIILEKTEALEESNIQYKQAKEKAEKSDMLKTTILSNISHELRTPMNAIIGFSRRLKESAIDSEDMEYVDVILTRGLDLLTIIDDILFFAEAMSSQIYRFNTTFHLDKLCNEIFDEYKEELLKFNDPQIQLKFKPYNKKDDINIFTDRKILKKIISSLLSNSIKFTKSGKIEFGYRITAKKEIKFYMTDTGIGISPEQTKKIFEYFIQSSNDYKKHSEGLGLGLPLSKKLVEILGGQIKLVSEPGKGSTFSFQIPYKSSKKS